MKPWAEKFYSSQAWRDLRAYCMKRDAYLCQDCIKRAIVTPAEEVHHIRPITSTNITNPAITLNPDNCISLCKSCHQRRHHGTAPKRYAVDDTGHVTISY